MQVNQGVSGKHQLLSNMDLDITRSVNVDRTYDWTLYDQTCLIAEIDGAGPAEQHVRNLQYSSLHIDVPLQSDIRVLDDCSVGRHIVWMWFICLGNSIACGFMVSRMDSVILFLQVFDGWSNPWVIG